MGRRGGLSQWSAGKGGRRYVSYVDELLDDDDDGIYREK